MTGAAAAVAVGEADAPAAALLLVGGGDAEGARGLCCCGDGRAAVGGGERKADAFGAAATADEGCLRLSKELPPPLPASNSDKQTDGRVDGLAAPVATRGEAAAAEAAAAEAAGTVCEWGWLGAAGRAFLLGEDRVGSVMMLGSGRCGRLDGCSSSSAWAVSTAARCRFFCRRASLWALATFAVVLVAEAEMGAASDLRAAAAAAGCHALGAMGAGTANPSARDEGLVLWCATGLRVVAGRAAARTRKAGVAGPSAVSITTQSSSSMSKGASTGARWAWEDTAGTGGAAAETEAEEGRGEASATAAAGGAGAGGDGEAARAVTGAASTEAATARASDCPGNAEATGARLWLRSTAE